MTSLERRLGPRRRQPERGASAVEFGLMTPLILLLLFGVIEFGVAFGQQLALGNGARQGARLGAVTSSCGEIVTDTRAASSTLGVVGDNVTVSIEVKTPDGGTSSGGCSVPALASDVAEPCKGSAAGSTLVVKSEFPSPLVIPFSPIKVTDLKLSGHGEFRCEYS